MKNFNLSEFDTKWVYRTFACCAIAIASGPQPPSPALFRVDAQLSPPSGDEFERIAAADDPAAQKPSDDQPDKKSNDDSKPGVGDDDSQEIDELDKRIDELIKRHNDVRRDEGLRPLVKEKKLSKAAAIHARDMADRETMSHEGGDGSTPADRVKKCGYEFLRIGENIAYGQTTTKEVVAGWLDSPPHRKNILGNFTEIGASVFKSKRGKLYWCVEFGVPKRRKR
jgi:uncharacterized protein YkwD